MSFVANRFTVVLDANVLIGERKRDMLLSYFHAGLFRGRWSEQILGEVQDNLLKANLDPIKIDSLLKTMSGAFPEAMVENHLGLADGVELPDENDRHVLSAAIRCGAQIIVTDNKKDFPAHALDRFDIEVLTADEFLVETFDLFKMVALQTVTRMRARIRKPPLGQSEFLMDLTAKGLPLMAAELREWRDFI